MNLEFEVNNQILKRIDSQDVVSKNHNIYKCRFTFDEESEWLDINKFVIFTDGWGISTTVHLGKSSDILCCAVPDSVLKGSYFKVSVYGGDLLTTNNVTVTLIESGYHRHHHGKTCNHGKDIFVEIFDSLENTVDSIIYNDNMIHLYNREKLLESIYLPFLDKSEVETLVLNDLQDYINENNYVFLTNEDKNKLDSVEEGANKTVIDSTLDPNSDNPISNKAVAEALNGKEDSYDYVERTDNIIQELIQYGEN